MAEPILDRERFVAQVTELQETLYRTARSILRNEQDAQDAVQEAVTQAFARLHTLRDPAKFKPWLLRILVNTCYDACRRRRSTVYLEAVEETLAAPQSDCEERMSLWSAVMRLPEEQKAVVTLFYYEDLPIRAISEVLGVTQGTVKTRLSRARGRLRQMLDQ
ncbi:MAG TPA: sigma-70 family RNA polymerase sigma factor [Candidatus Spyradocola merdavium]|nr:sigma-70 family RNA polymerase sigma factor [Candidatus Spyradocola merdavium]